MGIPEGVFSENPDVVVYEGEEVHIRMNEYIFKVLTARRV